MLGKILNNTYKLEKELVAGGMGQVYIASHLRLDGRRYAIKLLHPELAVTETFQKRFKDEAESMTALGHPNIVRIEDFLIIEGSYFLVMEFIAGDSLDRRIFNEGSMSPSIVKDLAVQLLEGLEYCHQQGIIHRDLKPSNLLLTESQQLKITDFGIALQDQQKERLTKPGTILGTPDYMSPEQILGHTTDARSDLYSVGIILFEMLAGHTPFPRNEDTEGSYVVLFAHMNTEAPPLKGSHIPPYLKMAVEKCLEKDPNKRFQSAEEMKQYLEDGGLHTTPEFHLAQAQEVLKPTIPEKTELPLSSTPSESPGTVEHQRPAHSPITIGSENDVVVFPSGDFTQVAGAAETEAFSVPHGQEQQSVPKHPIISEAPKSSNTSSSWLLIVFVLLFGVGIVLGWLWFRSTKTDPKNNTPSLARATQDGGAIAEKSAQEEPKGRVGAGVGPKGKEPGHSKNALPDTKSKRAMPGMVGPFDIAFWPERISKKCARLLGLCYKPCLIRSAKVRGRLGPDSVRCRADCWKFRKRTEFKDICKVLKKPKIY